MASRQHANGVHSRKVIQRRDHVWVPPLQGTKLVSGDLDATQLLIRAGFLRRAYSGIFHLLPLGLRVQEKLEILVDKHMRSINASKVSLSSISSEKLWARSGRLSISSEYFQLEDRNGSKFLLAPTHEEEITSVIADTVHSHNDLPIRLYQISRKYRDELRPRGGLLRGREFLMKDLYTFDQTQNHAHATYKEVRVAYRNFLDELKLNYIEARADSGAMGGDLSHEYHLPDVAGEDNIFHCTTCDYARNEEYVAHGSVEFTPESASESAKAMSDVEGPESPLHVIRMQFLSNCERNLIKVYATSTPAETTNQPRSINLYAVKKAVSDICELNTGTEAQNHESEQTKWLRAVESRLADGKEERCAVYYLFDNGISKSEIASVMHEEKSFLEYLGGLGTSVSIATAKHLNLLQLQAGDKCPQCEDGVLKNTKCIEVAHTFHLGTRYSSKLKAEIIPANGGKPVPVEMGCHGIGVSRLIAAITGSLSDDKGLNWPKTIAPYEVAILVNSKDDEKTQVALELYDQLSCSSTADIDVLLDDRAKHSLGFKLQDADLIGYPVLIVAGKGLDKEVSSQTVEVQCRRLKVKEQVQLKEVLRFVENLLAQL